MSSVPRPRDPRGFFWRRERRGGQRPQRRSCPGGSADRCVRCRRKRSLKNWRGWTPRGRIGPAAYAPEASVGGRPPRRGSDSGPSRRAFRPRAGRQSSKLKMPAHIRQGAPTSGIGPRSSDHSGLQIRTAGCDTWAARHDECEGASVGGWRVGHPDNSRRHGVAVCTLPCHGRGRGLTPRGAAMYQRFMTRPFRPRMNHGTWQATFHMPCRPTGRTPDSGSGNVGSRPAGAIIG